MNAHRTLLIGCALLALGGGVAPAMAQELHSSGDVVRASADGTAYQNGGLGNEQLADMARHVKSYDLQLALSEGRHNASATGVKLVITDAAGHRVWALDNAGPLIDVELPAGHYRVIADFGRVKQLGSVDVEEGVLATLYLHGQQNHS